MQSQQSLQFGQALIVSATQVSVPSGKVWKITGIYGTDRICVPCIPTEHTTSSSCNTRYVDFVGTAFYVNGNEIVSHRDWIGRATYENIYASSNCSPASQWDTFGITSFGWRMFDVPPNPNILPMWIPAGTTLKSATSNIYLSVLEFDIAP